MFENVDGMMEESGCRERAWLFWVMSVFFHVDRGYLIGVLKSVSIF